MQLTGQDIVPECRVGQLTLARGSCVPFGLDWTTAWAQPGHSQQPRRWQFPGQAGLQQSGDVLISGAVREFSLAACNFPAGGRERRVG